jgi:hypothetical protein
MAAPPRAMFPRRSARQFDDRRVLLEGFDAEHVLAVPWAVSTTSTSTSL